MQDWFHQYNYVGFIDGAWKTSQINTLQAGIGGFIMNNKRSISFEFSGPATGNTPKDVELQALQYSCQAIQGNDNIEGKIMIATDSSELAQQIQRLQTKPAHEQVQETQISNLRSIQISHLNRDFNKEADRLAKEGKTRS